MEAAFVDVKRVVKLCNLLRQSRLKDRRKIVEMILKEVDAIQYEHNENLVCIKHAKIMKGYAYHSSIYWLVEKRKIFPFRVCCRDYFSRRQIEKLPKAGPPAHLIPRKPVIKVGKG